MSTLWLARLLYLRGFLLIAAGAIAVRWPSETLASMLVAAGATTAILGLLELVCAVAIQRMAYHRYLAVLHAAVAMGFGAIALAAATLDVATLVSLCATWLVLHAILLLAIATETPRDDHARAAVLSWAAANVLFALAIAAGNPPSGVALEYPGALYAWAYGVALVVAGVWMRRHLPIAAPAPSAPISLTG